MQADVYQMLETGTASHRQVLGVVGRSLLGLAARRNGRGGKTQRCCCRVSRTR